MLRNLVTNTHKLNGDRSVVLTVHATSVSLSLCECMCDGALWMPTWCSLKFPSNHWLRMLSFQHLRKKPLPSGLL